jgi:hypothetical protein
MCCETSVGSTCFYLCTVRFSDEFWVMLLQKKYITTKLIKKCSSNLSLLPVYNMLMG